MTSSALDRLPSLATTGVGSLPFDDPAFGIEWPLPVAVISDRDRAWPPFEDGAGVRG